MNDLQPSDSSMTEQELKLEDQDDSFLLALETSQEQGERVNIETCEECGKSFLVPDSLYIHFEGQHHPNCPETGPHDHLKMAFYLCPDCREATL